MADKISKLILPVKSGDVIAPKEFDVGGGNTFVGTTAEWEALTTEQQNAYDCRVLTDDELPVVEVIDNLTSDSSTDPLSAKQGKVLKGLVNGLQTNFQAGVDSVYNAVVAKGSTPASKSLSDVVQGIGDIPTGIQPSGSISISQNGSVDVTNYATADVSVPIPTVETEEKTVTASRNGNTVTPSSGKYLSKVTVDCSNLYGHVIADTLPLSITTNLKKYSMVYFLYSARINSGSSGKIYIKLIVNGIEQKSEYKTITSSGMTDGWVGIYSTTDQDNATVTVSADSNLVVNPAISRLVY